MQFSELLSQLIVSGVSYLCVRAVVCVQAMSLRLCLYLTRLLCGSGGAGSAAGRDWRPLATWSPCGAHSWGHYTGTVQKKKKTQAIVASSQYLIKPSSPVWDLLRFLGLRLRVWIPSFFMARGRGTCWDSEATLVEVGEKKKNIDAEI